MAVDTSLPRIRTIAVTALISVTVLVGLKFVFDSYYVEMFEHEEYLKVGGVAPKELMELHAREAKSFASAPIPLDKAMEMVVRSRASTDSIRPEPSNDMAALVGWAQLPKTGLGSLPPLPPAPSASAAPGAPSASPPATTPSGSAAVSPPAVPGSAKPMSSAATPKHAASLSPPVAPPH